MNIISGVSRPSECTIKEDFLNIIKHSVVCDRFCLFPPKIDRTFISSHKEDMDCSVRNANYERVVTVVDKILKERYGDICTCQRCFSDMAAIALNYLPPHYYVDLSEKKDIGSPWVMVETAVIEAIDRVAENPNHPRMNMRQDPSPDSSAGMISG
jgi:hypothetical protein